MPPSTKPSTSVCAIRFIRLYRSRSGLFVPRQRGIDRRRRTCCRGKHGFELALLHLADHAAQQDGVAVAVGRELDAAVEGLVVGGNERGADAPGLDSLGR